MFSLERALCPANFLFSYAAYVSHIIYYCDITAGRMEIFTVRKSRLSDCASQCKSQCQAYVHCEDPLVDVFNLKM